MYLKDLVGKTAIRTMEPGNPFDSIWGINNKLRGRIWSPTLGDRGEREYMDEPSKIVNVKGDQVVIEYKGQRKLLEPKYIDGNWIEYEKLLHPEEEEQEKNEKIAKEVKAAAEPLRRFLAEYYDSTVSVTVTTDRVEVKRGEFQTSFFEAGGEEEDEEEDE